MKLNSLSSSNMCWYRADMLEFLEGLPNNPTRIAREELSSSFMDSHEMIGSFLECLSSSTRVRHNSLASEVVTYW